MNGLLEVTRALNTIRAAIDRDVINVDIEDVKNKLIELTQFMGLSAEANASAKKILEQKELGVLLSMDKKLSPSVQIRLLKAQCFEESALYEYADRLNSSLVHGIDGLRTVISLYKSELENSLKQ